MASAKTKLEITKWLTARNTLLGLNGRNQNLKEGLRLARQCDCEDAYWLARLFANYNEPPNPLDAQAIFQSDCNDARSLCYGTLISRDRHYIDWNDPKTPIRKAAKMGCALAQAWIAANTNDEMESVMWAKAAAAQHEPMGLCLLAAKYVDQNNVTAALPLFQEAAWLGDRIAQHLYALYAFQEGDRERIYWFGKSAENGDGDAVRALAETVERDDVSEEVLYEIGSVACAIPASAIPKRERALTVYQSCRTETRDAILMWAMVAKRMNVNKDVAREISKLLWKDKFAWSSAKKAKR